MKKYIKKRKITFVYIYGCDKMGADSWRSCLPVETPLLSKHRCIIRLNKWLNIDSTKAGNEKNIVAAFCNSWLLIIIWHSGVFRILDRGPRVRGTEGAEEGGYGRGFSLALVWGLPTNFFNFLNENGMFWCTLEHCFKVNVPATEGLTLDVQVLWL